MTDINDFAIHFSINGFVTTGLQIIAIVAYIIIISKYQRSVGAKLILAGGLLSLLGILGHFIFPWLLSSNDTDNMIKSQIIATYFSSFSFLVFTVGLMIFAIKDLKKNNNH